MVYGCTDVRLLWSMRSAAVVKHLLWDWNALVMLLWAFLTLQDDWLSWKHRKVNLGQTFKMLDTMLQVQSSTFILRYCVSPLIKFSISNKMRGKYIIIIEDCSTNLTSGSRALHWLPWLQERGSKWVSVNLSNEDCVIKLLCVATVVLLVSLSTHILEVIAD